MSRSFAVNLADHGGTAPASIVVVAKCPRPGTSKTRLIPALGEQGAADLAKAMMLDVLSTIAECRELNMVEKVLYYAPNDDESRMMLVKILRQHNLDQRWMLHPVKSYNDLQSSQLSYILQEALRIQQARTNGPVVFLGMDAPEIPLCELVAACFRCDQQGFLCPASDGGYCMLSVPASADSLAAFAGVQWSHPLTALSQLKALSDQGIAVTIGPLMHDVDDDDDLKALCRRLQQPKSNTSNHNTKIDSSLSKVPALSRPSLASRSIRLHQKEKTEPPVPEDEIRQDEQESPILSIATTFFETLTLSPPPSSKSSSSSSGKRGGGGIFGRRERPCPFTRRYLVSIGRLPPSMADDEEDEPLPDLFSCGTLSPSGDGLLQDIRAVWTKESSSTSP